MFQSGWTLTDVSGRGCCIWWNACDSALEISISCGWRASDSCRGCWVVQGFEHSWGITYRSTGEHFPRVTSSSDITKRKNREYYIWISKVTQADTAAYYGLKFHKRALIWQVWARHQADCGCFFYYLQCMRAVMLPIIWWRTKKGQEWWVRANACELIPPQRAPEAEKCRTLAN